MPDICMCAGEQLKTVDNKLKRTGENICPKRASCYRFTAVPSEYRQSYFAKLPYDEEKQSCDHYWDNRGR